MIGDRRDFSTHWKITGTNFVQSLKSMYEDLLCKYYVVNFSLELDSYGMLPCRHVCPNHHYQHIFSTYPFESSGIELRSQGSRVVFRQTVAAWLSSAWVMFIVA